VSDHLLFDPLFRVPFLTGFCLAVALSVIGALLRMRNEWLAALGLSQIAAAGGMVAALVGVPVLIGAFGLAAVTMLVKAALPRVGNSHYALIILAGWSATLLIGSYVDHGQIIGETLLRGQLYFTHAGHLAGALVLLVVALSTFRWLSRCLLTARFFPDYHRANRMPTRPYRTLFGLLVMTSAVLGTIALGAFPAFALLFVPSWVGFVLVDGWMRSVMASAVVGVLTYVAAFVLAMVMDLPFGPVLTGLLVLVASLRFVTALRRRGAELSGDNTQLNYLPPPERS
jgi:zinc/manganese transport system permease protein